MLVVVDGTRAAALIVVARRLEDLHGGAAGGPRAQVVGERRVGVGLAAHEVQINAAVVPVTAPAVVQVRRARDPEVEEGRPLARVGVVAVDAHDRLDGVQPIHDGRDDAERAAAPTSQRPEELGLGARVRDDLAAVREHDLKLEDVVDAHAVPARRRREAAALQPPASGRHRHAAAADGVVAPRDGAVGVAPRRAAADFERGDGARGRPAAVHVVSRRHLPELREPARPDQQRVARRRAALVGVARGLDRHLDVVLAREREDLRDVVGRGDLGDALGEIKGRLRLTEASVARRVLAAGAARGVQPAVRVGLARSARLRFAEAGILPPPGRSLDIG